MSFNLYQIENQKISTYREKSRLGKVLQSNNNYQQFRENK